MRSGKRMQPQEQDADAEHDGDQEDRHDNHERVGLSGRRDEARKVMRRGRIERCCQVLAPLAGCREPASPEAQLLSTIDTAEAQRFRRPAHSSNHLIWLGILVGAPGLEPGTR